MCSICNQIPCNNRCPNYKSKSNHYCSICNYEIESGEEYIENDIGEYAHWDCVDYGKDLARFLRCEIRTMEE